MGSFLGYTDKLDFVTTLLNLIKGFKKIIKEKFKMNSNFQNDLVGSKKPNTSPTVTGPIKDTKKVDLKAVVSTFADVRQSKNTPIQSSLDAQLPKAVGKFFTLIGAEYQSTPDYDDSTKINHSTIYKVRVTSKHAWLNLGTELTVKIKEQKPVISEEELDDLMFGENSKPIVLAFDELAYYHFSNGESLNASNARKLNLSPKEVMDYE